jgi:hypothetical protein
MTALVIGLMFLMRVVVPLVVLVAVGSWLKNEIAY